MASPQPPNGFLSTEASAVEEAAVTTPMLNAKLNGSSNAIKVKTSSETSGGTASNSRLPTVTTLSKTQLKVTQCLVLFIILVLVVILCSVFIRPEIFFSDYGKQF